MLVISFLLSVFFWTYLQLSVLLMFLLSWPAFLLFSYRAGFLYAAASLLLKPLLFFCFIRIELSGRENMKPGRPAIFTANHPGLIDPLYLIAYLPVRVRFVVEEGMVRIPLLGWVIRALDCIVVSKNSRDNLVLAGALQSALRRGAPALVFPENPRRGEEILASFNPGTIAIARAAGAAILPLVLKGSDRVLPKGGWQVTPGKIKICAAKPLDPQRTSNSELEAIYHALFDKM